MERTPGFSKLEINRFGKSLLKLNRMVLGLFVAWSILAAPAVAGKHTKDSLETVQSRMAEKKAVLIDVREEQEWKQGHLKVARLLPLSHPERGVSKDKLQEYLPKGKIVYLHCASGACCIEAAELLTEESIPEGELGDVIRLGRTLIEDTSTHPLTKDYVGNALNCTSCHLQNGLDPKAASFIGVASAYPAWSPREKRVITLEDRILNCFMRSCNGTRPPLGSRPSVAIAAWITWLSKDTPIRMNAKRPAGPNAITKLSVEASSADKSRGARLYADRCASCHGENGQGVDENPPVWGEMSYNQGAGFSNVAQLAAWLKVAMPMDDTTLTEQDAIDIAAYVNSHERPVFRLEDHLPKAEKLGEYNAEAESTAPQD